MMIQSFTPRNVSFSEVRIIGYDMEYLNIFPAWNNKAKIHISPVLNIEIRTFRCVLWPLAFFVISKYTRMNKLCAGGWEMEYLTLKEAGEKWGLTGRMVNYYCS